MARTVKIRPDQPLFKADAFRMPLWIHAPFEVVRGFSRWLSVTLAKDNPHGNPLDNATFTRPAKKPHRNAFWSGKPVVKGPKWVVMARRWGTVFTVLFAVKYAPREFWLGLARVVRDLLVWLGLKAFPWLWDNLGWLPLMVVGFVVTVYGLRYAFKRLKTWVGMRIARDGSAPWYVYVIAVERFVKRLAGKVRNR